MKNNKIFISLAIFSAIGVFPTFYNDRPKPSSTGGNQSQGNFGINTFDSRSAEKKSIAFTETRWIIPGQLMKGYRSRTFDTRNPLRKSIIPAYYSRTGYYAEREQRHEFRSEFVSIAKNKIPWAQRFYSGLIPGLQQFHQKVDGYKMLSMECIERISKDLVDAWLWAITPKSALAEDTQALFGGRYSTKNSESLIQVSADENSAFLAQNMLEWRKVMERVAEMEKVALLENKILTIFPIKFVIEGNQFGYLVEGSPRKGITLVIQKKALDSLTKERLDNIMGKIVGDLQEEYGNYYGKKIRIYLPAKNTSDIVSNFQEAVLQRKDFTEQYMGQVQAR